MRAHRVLGIRGAVPIVLGLGVLVFLVIVVSAVGVVHAVRLDHRLSGLSASIQVAQNQVENGKLVAAETTLGADETNLTSINSALYDSPDFRVLDVLPVAHQNLQAVKASVHLGLALVGDGRTIIGAASTVASPSGHLEVSLKGGQAPTQAISLIQSVLSSAVPRLPASPAPPHENFLVGPVRTGQQKVWTEAFKRRKELSSVGAGLTIFNGLTSGTGQHRYLIAVANMAEMRGAGGMILSYGVLKADNGKVSLGKFGPIDDLALKHPAPATFPADFLKTYANLQPSLNWRNATLMSDFTVDAPVMEAMYTQATGLPVDGVIQVDSAGLGALLAGVGPVTDPALGTVTATNVVPLTLNQAYLKFPDRPVRQEYLAGVAREAFSALTTRNLPSLRVLGTALVSSAAARHIVLYANDPSVEAAATSLAVNGALPGPGEDFAQLTVQNFGGDKLDYYLHSALSVTGTRPGGGPVGHLTATITLDNQAPPNGRSRYIFGPFAKTSKDPPGLYRGLVTLYLPAQSGLSATQATGATTTAPRLNSQNGLTAITYYVTIPAGAKSQMTLDVELAPRPKGPEHFVVVPTPRINPTQTSVSLS
ncbi:MAG: DUF4012 domain-containing protein [Acidimicrobiales bacterium]